MRLKEGTIYEVIEEGLGVPIGTRMEFVGGASDDVFTDGEMYTYLYEEEVKRADNQTPLSLTKEMQAVKAGALAGYDPELN